MKHDEALSDASPGTRVRVVDLAPGDIGTRLAAIGLLPGTVVTVGRRAPLGDPTLYTVRGAQFALRRSTARHVRVVSAESIDSPFPVSDVDGVMAAADRLELEESQ